MPRFPPLFFLQRSFERTILVKTLSAARAASWLRRLSLLALLVACVPSLAFAAGEERTALDEYIAKPDPAYEYHLVSKIPGDGVTTYVLEMTSQSWLTEKEVDRPVWKHWVIICQPDEVKHSTGLLYITGGANGGEPPSKPESMMSQIAKNSKAVVTELKMVPNQPLVFTGETQGRKEDSLIAYTWDKYLRTGDVKWPARLPMTKSRRAGDGHDHLVLRQRRRRQARRSTSSWSAADRSAAGPPGPRPRSTRAWWRSFPSSIDMLNVEPSFIHHWEAYGFWAPAVGDYVAMNLMDWNGTPEYQALMKIEEPFEYRSRLTMPKFIVNATRRPVLSARLVAVLFRRAAGREVSALRAQRRPQPEGHRRAVLADGLLRRDPEQDPPAPVQLEGREGRIDCR